MTDTLCTECSRPLPPDAPQALCPYCLLAMGDRDQTEEDAPRFRSRFQPPSPADLQQHFAAEQLEILELIGSGGMGAVYHARQPRLMRDVALKVLPPELASSPGFDDRFEREARVLARLDHANVVDVHDFGKMGPYSYLMLEYVDGVNLRDLMIGGLMEPSDAFEIIPQICEALQYAHDRGIVHRDIKPENILVDSRGRVKITDFGLAKIARPEADDRSLTGTHQVMGTPNYMAPEQIEKPRQVDHRADIYALGVVFYELLTGELPLGRFDPPSRKGNGPRRLDRVVMKTLEKEPERRYGQASDVKSDVEKVVGENASVAGARQAAEFVSQSATSARESIEAVAAEHPDFAKTAFAAAVASVYVAFFLSVFMADNSFVAFPLFVLAGCGMSMLVAYLHPRTTHHAAAAKAAGVPLWIDRQIRKLMRVFVADQNRIQAVVDGVDQDRNQSVSDGGEPTSKQNVTGESGTVDWIKLSSVAVPICFLISLYLFGVSVRQKDFFFAAMIFLAVSYAGARYRLARRPAAQLTKRERWCIYPPIVFLLAIIIVPVAIAPAGVIAAILFENSRDVEQFLATYGKRTSHIQVGAFSIAIVLVVQMLWMAFLFPLSRALRRGVRLLSFPFLREWDGRGTILGSLLCTSGAVIFGLVAIWAA